MVPVNELSIDNVLRVVQILVLLGSVTVSIVLYRKSQDDEKFKRIDVKFRESEARSAEIERAIAAETRFRTEELNTAKQRLGRIEEWRQHVPTHKDIQQINDELSEIGKQVAAVNERSDTTLEGVRRIESFLMDRGNR